MDGLSYVRQMYSGMARNEDIAVFDGGLASWIELPPLCGYFITLGWRIRLVKGIYVPIQ